MHSVAEVIDDKNWTRKHAFFITSYLHLIFQLDLVQPGYVDMCLSLAAPKKTAFCSKQAVNTRIVGKK